MKRKIIIAIISFIFIAVFSISAYAEVIALKSGEIIEGKIVEETDDYIKVDTGIGIDITYYFDEIEGIAKDEDLLKDSQKNNNQEKKLTPEEEQLNAMMNDVGLQKTPIGELKKKITEQKEAVEGQIEDKIDAVGDAAQDVGKGTVNIFKRIQAMTPRTGPFANLSIPSEWYDVHSQQAQLVIILLHFLFCFPLMMLSKKLGCNLILPWIPVINIFHLINMTRRSFWWVILLLIPGINIFAFFSLLMRVADLLQKPKFLGFLAAIPIVGLPFLWYLGLARNK